MRNLSIIVMVTVLLSPALAVAAMLRGFTRDRDGAAVAYVTVQVIGRASNGADVSQGVMSLDDGRYVFGVIPPGRYVVRFTRVGYSTREDSLTVADESELLLDAVLEVQPVKMEKIVVEGNRFSDIGDVQASFVTLKSERLSSLPGIAEGDPIRSLQLIPGVKAASDFSSGLYVRGGGPDQTLVLLDRATVYNPTHAFGFFSTFNGDATGDVNLYKGAYPAEHGGRLGAVLDVRSREGNTAVFAGKVGISTIASRAAFTGPVRGGSWSASARRTHLDPLLAAVRTAENPVPDYAFYDVNGRLVLPGAGGRFELSLYTGNDALDLDADAGTALNLSWGNVVTSAAYVRAMSDQLLLTARLSLSDYDSRTTARVFETPAGFENEIRDVTAAADVTWEAGTHHTLSGGVQATKYDVGFRQDFNTSSVIEFRREPFEGAVFVEDRWRPWAETTIDLGARVRYLDDGERWLVEPRGALAQSLSPTVRMKLAGGVYHQYLQLVATEGVSAADYYVPIDESAEIGRSWQAVAGVDWRARPSLQVSVEGYYTDLENLVALDNSTTVDDEDVTADGLFYLNGTGYATGFEVFLRRDVGTVTGWLGYTLGWTRRTFPEINDGGEYPPKYDRRHDVSLVTEHARGPWRFGSAFVYATGQAFTPVSAQYSLRNPTTGVVPEDVQLLYGDRNSARLLAYDRLDVSVARDFSLFGAKAEWLVEVFNLYSRRNEWFVQYERSDNTVEAEVVKMLPIIPSIGVNVWF